MKEYEIVLTYLNGCAGSAYPLTSFEEAELNAPADYIRAKHTKDFDKFVSEIWHGELILSAKMISCHQSIFFKTV